MYNSSLNYARTRSRSNSISSSTSSVNETAPVQSSSAATVPIITAATNLIDVADMTKALTRSLQVVGATSSWDTIKSDIKSIRADMSRIEKKLDDLIRKQDQGSFFSEASSSQTEAAVPRVNEDRLFAPGKPMYNTLSVSNILNFIAFQLLII